MADPGGAKRDKLLRNFEVDGIRASEDDLRAVSSGTAGDSQREPSSRGSCEEISPHSFMQKYSSSPVFPSQELAPFSGVQDKSDDGKESKRSKTASAKEKHFSVSAPQSPPRKAPMRRSRTLSVKSDSAMSWLLSADMRRQLERHPHAMRMARQFVTFFKSMLDDLHADQNERWWSQLLCILSFGSLVIGVLRYELVECDSWDTCSDHQKRLDYGLGSVVSFTTLLCCLVILRVYLIQFTVKRRKWSALSYGPHTAEAPLYSFWRSRLPWKISFEILIHLLHAPPALGTVYRGLGLAMFLRAYLLIRLVRDRSAVYAKRRTIIGQISRVAYPRFGWRLSLKLIFYSHTYLTMLFLFLSIWFVMAFCFYVAERNVHDGLEDFSTTLYFTFITMTTIGYGDFRPQTVLGRSVAVCAGFLGVGFTLLASAMMTNKLKLNANQTFTKDWLVLTEMRRKERSAAATLIQLVWTRRKHLNRNSSRLPRSGSRSGADASDSERSVDGYRSGPERGGSASASGKGPRSKSGSTSSSHVRLQLPPYLQTPENRSSTDSRSRRKTSVIERLSSGRMRSDGGAFWWAFKIAVRKFRKAREKRIRKLVEMRFNNTIEDSLLRTLGIHDAFSDAGDALTPRDQLSTSRCSTPQPGTRVERCGSPATFSSAGSDRPIGDIFPSEPSAGTSSKLAELEHRLSQVETMVANVNQQTEEILRILRRS